MVQPLFEIAMSVPVAKGVVRELVFRSGEAFEGFPVWFLERGINGGTGFPVHPPRPYGITGTGNPPPVPPPLTGEERCSPLTRSVGVVPRNVGEEHNLGGRLQELRAYQAELLASFNRVQDALGPADARQAETEERIVATHGDAFDFSDAAIEARKPLFAILTDLSQRYGALRIRRRDLNSQRKAISREIATLERQLQKQGKPGQRRAA